LQELCQPKQMQDLQLNNFKELKKENKEKENKISKILLLIMKISKLELKRLSLNIAKAQLLELFS
jgi:hypothetical protein